LLAHFDNDPARRGWRGGEAWKKERERTWKIALPAPPPNFTTIILVAAIAASPTNLPHKGEPKENNVNTTCACNLSPKLPTEKFARPKHRNPKNKR